METQGIFLQNWPWLVCLLAVALAVWSATGTPSRGIRSLLFVFIGFTVTSQHQSFVIMMLHQIGPETNWLALQNAVNASITCLMFILLTGLHHMLWRPASRPTYTIMQRTVSGLCGTGAGWLLGVLILLGAADAAHIPLTLESASHAQPMTLMLQSAVWLSQAVASFVP